METKRDMKEPVRVTISMPWLSESIFYEFNGDTGKMHIEVTIPANQTATVSCRMEECFWPADDAKPSSTPNR